MAVELYYFQPLGTNSGRVYLTLLEKGVPFVERELKGRDFEHLKPAYLAINPKGQVPTLVHNGTVLTEGMLINEYIDEAFDGPPLRPAGPRERWRMRTWCRWSENDLGRCLMMIMWNRVVPTFVGDRSIEEVKEVLAAVPDPDRRRAWLNAFQQTTPPEQLEDSHRRIREGVQKVERHLQTLPWFAGPSHSLADIDFLNFCGGFLARFMPEVMNETATPATVAWLARMEERSAVKAMRARTDFSLATARTAPSAATE